MERVALTPEGKGLIVKEILYREGELREKIIKDIAEARAHGDISENSEFVIFKYLSLYSLGVLGGNMADDLGAPWGV